MLVLVTGGAGFVGLHVTEQLLRAGHQVRVLDALVPTAHPTGGWPPTLPGEAERLRGDVRDPAAVAAALAGAEAVSHQAALVGYGRGPADLPRFAEHNDLGTAVLLAGMARAGVSRLVLASSMVVYGEGAYRCPEHGRQPAAPRAGHELAAGRYEHACPACGRALDSEPVTEDAPLDPRTAYAASKVAQEHLAGVWARDTGGVVTALRYHNVFGPGMPRDSPYSGVAALFRSELEAGRPPRVFEDGGQQRDFIHVRDIARANLAALSCPTSRAYNVATGRPRTILEFATALATELGGPPPVVTGQFRSGDVRHLVASPQRLQSELGLRPARSFAEDLAEFARAPLRAAADPPLAGPRARDGAQRAARPAPSPRSTR